MSRIRTLALRGTVAAAGAALAATLAGGPAHADSIQAEGSTVTTTGTLGTGAAPGGKVTRDQVIKRAQAWVDQAVPYSANGLTAPYSWWADQATGGRWRQDCSGYVSMAWQLPHSEVTGTLPNVAIRISTADLKPGDILNSPEHVVIFGGWIDRDRGTFAYYHESSRSRPTSKNTDGNLYASMLASHPLSTYKALRYKNITDDTPAPSPTAPTAAPAPTQATPPPAAEPGRRKMGKSKSRTRQQTVTVTAGNRLYAIARDGGSVHAWHGEGKGADNGANIGGPATSVYAGRAGLFATNPATGDIYKYNGKPHQWARVGGPGRTFAVTGDNLYGLAPDGSGVYQWTGHGTAWKKIGGPATTIYAGGAGLFATNPATGDVYKYDGSPNRWTRVGGPGRAFAVSDKHLYGLSPDGSGVYQWTGRGAAWKKIGGPAASLHAGGAGLYATNPATGDLHKYNSSPGNWTRIGGPGRTFAVSNDTLYGLSPDGSELYRWTGRGTTWTYVGALAASD